MDWTQTLTIIASIAGIITGYAFLLNKRIDDTNRRIDDLREDLNRRMDRLEDELKEIRMLLYKVLEVPHKEEK
ncbi:hypothetical protein [Thermocrinis jamiesonii]|jgi:hypothetical protein|uniref:hypothetical protein n=1 Tax=Thermocrinis jamiesonii TaxID=1302351 RepID=UPI00049744E5|nr:hypothetical protein [Thermocrinis jamiesonii]